HSIGSPPHWRGTGNPPKLSAPSSPYASSRLTSLGPTYISARPSHDCPGGIVAVAWSPTVTLPVSWPLPSALGSAEVTSLNPPVLGIIAARYHVLPIPIHVPSSVWPPTVARFSIRPTWPPLDHTTSVACCPGNFSAPFLAGG